MPGTEIPTTEPEAHRIGRAEDYRARLRGSFVMIPLEVLATRKDDGLTYMDIVIYLHMIRMQGENENHWWSIKSMAKAVEIGETEVKKSLERLEAAGHITRTRLKGKRTSVTCCLSVVKKGGDVLVKGHLSPRNTSETTRVQKVITKTCVTAEMPATSRGQVPPVDSSALDEMFGDGGAEATSKVSVFGDFDTEDGIFTRN